MSLLFWACSLDGTSRSYFLKQRNAQKKITEPSEGTGKRKWVEPSHEDMHIDPTAAVVDDEEEDVDVAAVASPFGASPSLRSMLKRVLET